MQLPVRAALAIVVGISLAGVWILWPTWSGRTDTVEGREAAPGLHGDRPRIELVESAEGRQPRPEDHEFTGSGKLLTLSDTGSPLSDCKIALLTRHRGSSTNLQAVEASSFTDADGWADLPAPDSNPDLFDVVVIKEGFQTLSLSPSHAARSGDDPVVRLTPAQEVQVACTTADGSPVAGALVVAGNSGLPQLESVIPLGSLGEPTGRKGDVAFAYTDSSGVARLKGLQPGSACELAGAHPTAYTRGRKLAIHSEALVAATTIPFWTPVAGIFHAPGYDPTTSVLRNTPPDGLEPYWLEETAFGRTLRRQLLETLPAQDYGVVLIGLENKDSEEARAMHSQSSPGVGSFTLVEVRTEKGDEYRGEVELVPLDRLGAPTDLQQVGVGTNEQFSVALSSRSGEAITSGRLYITAQFSDRGQVLRVGSESPGFAPVGEYRLRSKLPWLDRRLASHTIRVPGENHIQLEDEVAEVKLRVTDDASFDVRNYLLRYTTADGAFGLADVTTGSGAVTLILPTEDVTFAVRASVDRDSPPLTAEVVRTVEPAPAENRFQITLR